MIRIVIFGLLLAWQAPVAADTATWTTADGLPVAETLVENPEGLIMLGGPNGFYMFDGERFTPRTFTAGGTADVPQVRQLRFVDGRGMWAGTTTGLRRLIRDGRITRPGANAGAHWLRTEPITALELEVGRGPWAATADHLFHMADGGFAQVFDPAGAPIAGVVAIAAAREGTWLATADRVLLYRDGTLVDAGAAAGLPGKLALDAEGALWIGRADGLWRVREHAERVDPRAVTALVGPKLYVANADGVFALERGALVRVLDHPSASELHVGERAVWALSRDRLSLVTIPSDAPLNIRVKPVTVDGDHAAITYMVAGAAGAHGLEFRYRLDGADRDWIAAGSRTRAVYDDLAPRSYRFRVAARTPGGAWSDESFASFTIEPRLWQTTWFRITAGISLVVLAAALALALQLRRRRREAAAAAAVEHRVETEVAYARETERLAAYGQMVAGVAHEVRQPLFAISTASYVISEKVNDPELRPQITLLDREVKRMSSMMDDLLDFARPAQLLLGPTEVAPLLAETLDIVGPDGKDTELAIGKIEVDTIEIDRARMQQVLVNLVQNAKKHAQGAKRIELSARRDGSHVVLEVKDDGAPIPPDRLARLFEPFFTTGNGTGLGLPIAKRIVELHGGTLTVRSDDTGVCFTITLEGKI